MNTKVITGIVAVVVILGGGYYFYSQQGSGADDANNTPTDDGSDTVDTSNKSGSFMEVLAAGSNVQCEFSSAASETDVNSGQVYVTDGGERIRGVFMSSGSSDVQSNLIRRDGYNYVWGSSLPQGIKIPIPEEDKGKLFNAPGSEEPANASYSCMPWIVDDTLFDLPPTVEFMELEFPVMPDISDLE